MNGLFGGPPARDTDRQENLRERGKIGVVRLGRTQQNAGKTPPVRDRPGRRDGGPLDRAYAAGKCGRVPGPQDREGIAGRPVTARGGRPGGRSANREPQPVHSSA
ncbi:MAG TPA: hypothetical protein VGD53_32005 [Actinoallomurus sp.]